MSGYVKLFSSILDSTIWDTPPAITKVWFTLMAMADRDGVVEASVPGLANRARIDIETTEKAIALFMAPDKYSKTPDYEGRRLAAIEGGWILLTYSKHREKMSADDIREKNAARQRRWRERHRNGNSNGKSQSVTENGAGHDIAEAEAERSVSSSSEHLEDPQTHARSNDNARLTPYHERPRVFLAACTPAFLAVFDRYPRKDAKQEAAQVFQELAADYPGGETALSAAIVAAFDAGMLDRHPYRGENRTRPFLDKVLAARRWEDPPSAPDDAEPHRLKPGEAAAHDKRQRELRERMEARAAREQLERQLSGGKVAAQ